MTVRLPSSTYPNDETGRKTWVRAVYDALGGLVAGKQDESDNLTSIAGLTLTGNSGDAIVVKATEDGFELAAGAGGGGTTTNALTITNTGGAAAGATFNGSAAVTIDYSTVGAAASGHDHDSDYLQLTGGTLTGDLSVPDEAYDATNWNGSLEVPTKNAVRDKIETLGGRVLISEQTATGVEHVITFSSIPGSYRSLVLEIFGRTDEAAVGSAFTMTCNNDTSAIYDAQRQYAQGTTGNADQFLSTAGWTTTISLPGSTAAASHPGYVVFELLNYSDTTFYKAMRFQGRQMNSTTTGNAYTMHGGGSYRSTSAISRIDLTIATAAKVFVTGSKFRLYGIS